VHLQRGHPSVENPAGNAPAPRIPHSPYCVAHHHGNDFLRWSLACFWQLFLLLGDGRGEA
jgi:hypothetical protein